MDGGIKFQNSSGGTVNLVVDIEGWYSNVGNPIPVNQTRTQKFLTLQADAGGGGPWVTYKYRTGSVGDPITSFTPVPTGPSGNVTVPGSGTKLAGWPVSHNAGGTFDPYTWDLAATVGGGDQLVQVEACYGTAATDPPASLVCSMPANVQLAAHAFGDSYSTTDLGPGTVAELTGDFQVSATDVTVGSYLGSLTVGRTLTTLAPTGEQPGAPGVFGPGWTSSFPGPDTGDGDLTVTDQSAAGYLLFTGSDGSATAYQATSPTGSYPISFVGAADAAADGTTVSMVTASKITMTDPDGTITTWTKATAGWAVATIVQAGPATSSPNLTTTITTDPSSGRITRILGAVPNGVSCATDAPGCRSLTFGYTPLTVGGATVWRLSTVNLVAYNPATSTMNTTAVAAYDYDSTGHLADEYDPRITPNLKTAYTYDGNGRLATLTPPGLAAWTLGYNTAGQLTTASRPDPAGGTATSTVAYGVAFTGSTAPVDVGAAAAATWGQTTDLAATGTAVFDPDHVPAATPTATDWPYAKLDFIDANGRTVNTASYGDNAWQVDATQFDNNGNNVWSLTAGNLAQALSTTGDTDPVAVAAPTTAARAALLASSTVYNPLNPAEVTDTFGPIHPVIRPNGAPLDARSHTATSYDEGAPDSTVYALPTTVTKTAQTSGGVDHDPIVTHTGYAAINTGDTTGWALRMPTSTTTQLGASPSAADLTTITRYNTAGQTIETRLPADAAGGDARSTLTSYYTATGTGSLHIAGASRASVHRRPRRPTLDRQSTAGHHHHLQHVRPAPHRDRNGRRTTEPPPPPTTPPDAAAPSPKPSRRPPAGGTAIPTTTTGYDPTTGLATTVAAGGQTLTIGYDTLGRQTSYTDGTGITSTTTYDLDGRVATHNDGKGTVTSSYDGATEHRGLLTSETVGVGAAPGTFTGSYDPDGNLTAQTYPNGLVATRHYDNAGGNTSLGYDKAGSTWMAFTAGIDAQGRIVDQTSPAIPPALHLRRRQQADHRPGQRQSHHRRDHLHVHHPGLQLRPELQPHQPVQLPRRRRLQHRQLQHLHHTHRYQLQLRPGRPADQHRICLRHAGPHHHRSRHRRTGHRLQSRHRRQPHRRLLQPTT